MKKVILKDTQIIAKHHTHGRREYRIPGILPIKNGLLLTYEARNGEGEENLGDWGDIDVIVLKLENDKEPIEVFKAGECHLPKSGSMRTYNNPVLIPDEHRVHLIYHKNYEEAYIVTSEDQGDTWSEPRDITKSFREFSFEWNWCATGPGHGIQLESGRILASIWLGNGKLNEDGSRHGQSPEPIVAGFIYSDDHGITWQAGALMESFIGCGETCVAWLGNDRLLFNSRRIAPYMRRLLGISSDGGETIENAWSPRELRDPGCYGGFATCSDGVLFANCDDINSRINLTVKYSADEGASWDTIWEVDPVSGYPDLAVVGDTVYVFYERSGNWQIDELVLKTGQLITE